MNRARPWAARGAALVVVASASVVARADTLRFGPHDVTSLFVISKSENKNQVVYAIHLDENCAPVGDAPIFAYWRMYEKGPHVTEPLLSREEGAYGVARQHVTIAGATGGTVDLTLRALPDRPIVIRTQRLNDTCRAWSKLPIGGVDAYLYNVHVKLGFLSVDYLLLSGWTLDGARVVTEKIQR